MLVWIGRVAQVRGDGLEVAHHDDEVVDVHRLAEDHGPLGAHEVQGADHQVLRDDAGVKEHHDDEEAHEDLLPHQVGPGEHIGGHDGQDDVDDRAHQGDEDGVEDGGHQVLVAEDDLVVDQGEAPGQDLQAAHGAGLAGVRQGTGQNVQQGHQHGQRDQQQNRHEDPLQNPQTLFLFAHHHHTPSPVSFLDVTWVRYTRTTPTRPLMRETVVAMEYWAFSIPRRLT